VNREQYNKSGHCLDNKSAHALRLGWLGRFEQHAGFADLDATSHPQVIEAGPPDKQQGRKPVNVITGHIKLLFPITYLPFPLLYRIGSTSRFLSSFFFRSLA
jgi:hypothetical protein